MAGGSSRRTWNLSATTRALREKPFAKARYPSDMSVTTYWTLLRPGMGARSCSNSTEDLPFTTAISRRPLESTGTETNSRKPKAGLRRKKCSSMPNTLPNTFGHGYSRSRRFNSSCSYSVRYTKPAEHA